MPGFKNNYFAEICTGSGEGSYFRLIDFFFTGGNSRVESNKEEEVEETRRDTYPPGGDEVEFDPQKVLGRS